MARFIFWTISRFASSRQMAKSAISLVPVTISSTAATAGQRSRQLSDLHADSLWMLQVRSMWPIRTIAAYAQSAATARSGPLREPANAKIQAMEDQRRSEEHTSEL